MTIYIEQVLLTNFIIDFCILSVVSKLVLAKNNYRHITLSALFGSVSSLVLPYCSNLILVNALKILTAIIMLQILHIHKKQLLLSTFTMLVLSYIIGGAILSNLATQTANGYAISNVNLVYVFVVTFIFTFITCRLIYWLKYKITTSAQVYDTTLIHNNNKITVKGFIDSGNGLYDNNQPVNIINFDTFKQLTNITLNQYLTNDFDKLINPHFIEANTIAGKRKILVFTINELRINSPIPKTYHNVSIGVSLNFDNTKEYKAILNSSFCFN